MALGTDECDSAFGEGANSCNSAPGASEDAPEARADGSSPSSDASDVGVGAASQPAADRRQPRRQHVQHNPQQQHRCTPPAPPPGSALEGMRGATRGLRGSFLKPGAVSRDLSPMDELIAIIDGGRHEAAADDTAQPRNTEAEMENRTTMLRAYAGLRRDMGDGRPRFDEILNRLRTVFIDDQCEVEGDNVAHNVRSVQLFLQEKAAALLQGTPVSPRVNTLYEQFIEPQADADAVRHWGLSTSQPELLPRPPELLPQQGCEEGVPDRHTPTPGGLSGHSEVRAPRRRQKKDDNAVPSRPRAEFEAYIASFAHTETRIWESLRAIAQDASISADQCASRMIETVLRHDSTAWWDLYQHVELFKRIGADYEVLQARLQEKTAECTKLREENILNSAFLSGDLAQGMVDEIQETRAQVQDSKDMLAELGEAIARAGEERTAREEDTQELYNKLKRAQDMLKALHSYAAECEALFPPAHCAKAAVIVSAADQQLIVLQPDCGAPSGKRCPACLAVATITPYCPLTGGRHSKMGEFPEDVPTGESGALGGRDGGGGSPSSHIQPRSVRPLLRMKQKRKLDASAAVVALVAAIAARTVGEECPCGTSMVMRRHAEKGHKKRREGKRASSSGVLPDIYNTQRSHSRGSVSSLMSEASFSGDLEESAPHTEIETHVFILLVKELISLMSHSNCPVGEVGDLFAGGAFGSFAKYANSLKKIAIELAQFRTEKSGARRMNTMTRQSKGDTLFVS